MVWKAGHGNAGPGTILNRALLREPPRHARVSFSSSSPRAGLASYLEPRGRNDESARASLCFFALASGCAAS